MGIEYPLKYPDFPDYEHYIKFITEYSRLKYEYGAHTADIQELIDDLAQSMRTTLKKIMELPGAHELADKEPNDLATIHALRSEGPRKLWNAFHRDKYMEKIYGSLYGRFAGCILGDPVELWSIEAMKSWAEYNGDDFPPTDYWSHSKDPSEKRYGVSYGSEYTRYGMDGVPVDDDITYTILGLLIAEDYTPEFTIEQIGEAWVKYLPCACTAEDIALRNLKAGISPYKAGETNNPYCQWIGADIRADSWGYMAPGLPQKAAEMAYKDAYISHRRNGIYGEMFFSAAIAAAFEVDNALDAIKIGLTEVPEDCMLANDVRWALETCKEIKNHMDAKNAVMQRFEGQSPIHTNVNACLTIFGLNIGGDDFTKVISETVAMGYDNDCTAATAGSIIGTILGSKGIPVRWYEKFNNKVYSYINGHRLFKIDDLAERFALQAETVHRIACR
jgi:ADP-ribosylglycohydrolase